MGQTDRREFDLLDRKANLARMGKLPSGSRRSNEIREIAQSLNEDMDYDDPDSCPHTYDCDCDLIALEANQ